MSRLLTSAKVTLFINGYRFGRVHTFGYTVTTPHNEIYGIDSVEPYELATTTSHVSGTLGVYKTLSDGAVSGLGLSTPIANLAESKPFSLTLVEIPTQITIFESTKCSLESESWAFEAKGGVIRGQFTFKGITYKNEVKAK